MQQKVCIRTGEPKDVGSVMNLIRQLAIFERAEKEVEITETILLKDGFGEKPLFEFFVAELDSAVVGLALYYTKYSTWKGACIYLEDLIVDENHRNLGIGQVLFDAVKHIAKQRNAGRMEWQVLDWNENAIRFYQKQNAVLDDEWLNGKLTREMMASEV
jgi:GNAT superfamily N-acetyltransferase